ncbi:helix-turn-helix domain-containing protein, partial [Klebsiella pneumoniae]|uniref:helix-turn-helix domain-containing protein n=1 Tax=Klebsiella pneumoniae TaxID=573 RepID=UPI00356305AB
MMAATALMQLNLQIANRTSSEKICDMQRGGGHNRKMTFGERLKIARRRRFDTGKEAASYLGISYGTYGGHEAASRVPKRESVDRYAKAFGVRVAWLEYEEGPMTDHTTVPLVGYIS